MNFLLSASWFTSLLIFHVLHNVISSKAGQKCGIVTLKNTSLDSEENHGIDKFVCVDCLIPDNCLANDTCKHGTMGNMCEKCVTSTIRSENYYRMGSVCVQCPEVPWSAICFCVYIIIFLACFMVYGFSESMCTKIKLLIHYLQFLVLTMHVKLSWPHILLRTASALNFGVFNSNILLPGCIFRKLDGMRVHFLEWYSSLCIPILAVIVGLLLDRSFKVLISRQGRQTNEGSERRMKKLEQRLKLRRFVCMILLVMYMPALVSCMRTLQCSGTIMQDLVLDKTKDVFLLDTEYSCRTFMFQVVHSIAVFYMVAIILFTLMVLFFTLRQKKWNLLDKEWMLYSPVYESYKNKYCFWEAVVLVRKLASIMITESHPVRPLWQISIQLGMTTIYILMIIVLRPYRSCFWKYPRLNNHIAFEVMSNISLFLFQGIGLSIVSGYFKEEYSYIVIISVAVVLIVWLVLMAAMKWENENETHLMEISLEDEGPRDNNGKQTYNCLKCFKKNRVEPDPQYEEKMKERKQNIDF